MYQASAPTQFNFASLLAEGLQAAEQRRQADAAMALERRRVALAARAEKRADREAASLDETITLRDGTETTRRDAGINAQFGLVDYRDRVEQRGKQKVVGADGQTYLVAPEAGLGVAERRAERDIDNPEVSVNAAGDVVAPGTEGARPMRANLLQMLWGRDYQEGSLANQRYGIDVGAATSRYGAQLGYRGQMAGVGVQRDALDLRRDELEWQRENSPEAFQARMQIEALQADLPSLALPGAPGYQESQGTGFWSSFFNPWGATAGRERAEASATEQAGAFEQAMSQAAALQSANPYLFQRWLGSGDARALSGQVQGFLHGVHADEGLRDGTYRTLYDRLFRSGAGLFPGVFSQDPDPLPVPER